MGFSFREFMDKEGLTPAKLVNQLKKELKANQVKTVKLRGAVGTGTLAKGKRIIAQSGIIYHGKDEDDYGDGETLIEWCEPDMATRQRARIDAHKLRGDYPAEKSEGKIDQTVNVTIRRFSEEPIENGQANP